MLTCQARELRAQTGSPAWGALGFSRRDLHLLAACGGDSGGNAGVTAHVAAQPSSSLQL